MKKKRAERVLALMAGRLLFIGCLIFVWSANFFYYGGKFRELSERLQVAGFELELLAEEVARGALIPGAMTAGGPFSAIYVSAFLGFFYAAAMLLWRLWDRQVFLVLMGHLAVAVPEVTAVAYVVVVGWSCGTALRFYHGGGLMGNWWSVFAIGEVFVLSFLAVPLIIGLWIWFRTRFRPPRGLS